MDDHQGHHACRLSWRKMFALVGLGDGIGNGLLTGLQAYWPE